MPKLNLLFSTLICFRLNLLAHCQSPFVPLSCSVILSLSLIVVNRRSVSLSLTQTIRAVQPDVVVVELCQYRVSMLNMDESTLLREAKDVNLDKVQQAIKQVRLSE